MRNAERKAFMMKPQKIFHVLLTMALMLAAYPALAGDGPGLQIVANPAMAGSSKVSPASSGDYNPGWRMVTAPVTMNAGPPPAAKTMVFASSTKFYSVHQINILKIKSGNQARTKKKA